MKKATLPEKTCIACGKPMAWRKKWAKAWEDVKYCSARCRREKNRVRNEDATEQSS